jgi:hypothetical protein
MSSKVCLGVIVRNVGLGPDAVDLIEYTSLAKAIFNPLSSVFKKISLIVSPLLSIFFFRSDGDHVLGGVLLVECSTTAPCNRPIR